MTIQLPLIFLEVFHGNLFISLQVNIPCHDVCFHGHYCKLDRLIIGEDEKLPTIEQLQLINENIADKVLTEIQNGILSKVTQEQLALKKKAKHELKDILKELDRLNRELLQTEDQADVSKKRLNKIDFSVI